MSVGPIPVSKIADMADRLYLEGEDNDRFMRIIRQLDGAFLDLSNPSSDKSDVKNEVPADDTAGAKALFSRLQARNKRDGGSRKN